MEKEFNILPQVVQSVLPILLQDKTTKKNIVFATDSYADKGAAFAADCEITMASLWQLDLKPRILKSSEEQSYRTRKKAEVFTPAWLCCKMNNHCDDEWFGVSDVFNHLDGDTWKVTEAPVQFPEGKDWKMYVDSRRLEITCGEAPYIVSRYDAATGNRIEIKDRIGILDRKLRVVNENTKSRDEWFKWTLRAFQSVYGYEWQGDSLLIARINLLMTFLDYYKVRWEYNPLDEQLLSMLSQIANVIAWNIWQMDGLTGRVPYGEPEEKPEEPKQLTFFDMGWDLGDSIQKNEENELTVNLMECRIFDWRSNESLIYNKVKKG